MRALFIFLIVSTCFGYAVGYAAPHAFVSDPDGYSNLRSEPSSSSKIVEVLMDGEMVRVTSSEGDWVKVHTHLENEGFVHQSRLKMLKDGSVGVRPDMEPIYEQGKAAARLGVDYPVVLKYAFAGQENSIRLLFWFTRGYKFDGGAATGLAGDLWELAKTLGDAKFAELLSAEPAETRKNVISDLQSMGSLEEFPIISKLR